MLSHSVVLIYILNGGKYLKTKGERDMVTCKLFSIFSLCIRGLIPAYCFAEPICFLKPYTDLEGNSP